MTLIYRQTNIALLTRQVYEFGKFGKKGEGAPLVQTIFHCTWGSTTFAASGLTV